MLICTGKLKLHFSVPVLKDVKSVLLSTVAEIAREMDRTGYQKSTTGKHILNTIPDPIFTNPLVVDPLVSGSTGLEIHWFGDGRGFAWGVNLVLLGA